MDENHQDMANSNQTTTENKIWLPPSYTNHKSPPLSPAPKKGGINWGFADKSFWEWLLFLWTFLAALGAITIPFVVTIIGLNFTQQQAQLSIAASERQHQTDLQIAQDQQRETTLKSYLDDMSDLLLNHNLHQSKPGDEVRQIARERTLTTLRRLDADRNGIVVQFLQDAHLIGGRNAIIDLSFADLRNDDLRFVNLSNVNLSNVSLYGAYLHGTDLSGANLRNVYLGGVDLSHADLYGAYLYGSYLYGANLSNADLRGVNLSLSDVRSVNLHGTDLRGANLSGTDLDGTDLRYTYLSNINLSGIQLTVNLHSANLHGANLHGANLHGVYLRGVDLSNADLSGADLSGATVTQEQLNEAKSLQDTIMPDGSKHL